MLGDASDEGEERYGVIALFKAKIFLLQSRLRLPVISIAQALQPLQPQLHREREKRRKKKREKRRRRRYTGWMPAGT